MKRICTCCTCLFLALVLSLLSTNASAQVSESGLDLRASLDVPVVILAAGIGLDLSFGYRWAYGGIYVSQDLDFIFANNSFADIGEYSHEENYGAWFQGATYLTGLGFIPISDDWEMFLGAGVGVMYYSDDFNSTSDKSEDSIDNPCDLAFKFMFGMTRYINDRLGVGFNLNYSLEINSYKDSDGEYVYINHTIYPGIQLDVKF